MGDRLATIDVGQKEEGCCAPFGGAGSPPNTMLPGPTPTQYLHTKWHLHPSSRLATTDMGQKLWGRGVGSPSNTMWPGPRSTCLRGIFIHSAIWPQQIWAENWGLCPSGGRGGESPSNTIWPGPRPTCTPSFIVIHPTVWPQCTNITNRTGQTGQRSNSIGRTVLQTVTQKHIPTKIISKTQVTQERLHSLQHNQLDNQPTSRLLLIYNFEIRCPF